MPIRAFMIRPSERKIRPRWKREIEVSIKPIYAWASVVVSIPSCSLCSLPPQPEAQPYVGFSFDRALRGHNPALANVDQTDADKRAEWG